MVLMTRLRKNKVVDFFTQSFSVDRTGRGAPATRMLFLITSMLLVFVVWASFVELDEVVSAQGKAVSFANLQVVEHYEGGRVQKFLSAQEIALKREPCLYLLALYRPRVSSMFKNKAWGC